MKIKRFYESKDEDPFNEEVWEYDLKVGQKVKYRQGRGNQRYIGVILSKSRNGFQVRWYLNNKVSSDNTYMHNEDIEPIEGETDFKTRNVFRLDVMAYDRREFIGFFAKRWDAMSVVRRLNYDDYIIRELEVPDKIMIFEDGEYERYLDSYENMSKKQKFVVQNVSRFLNNDNEKLGDDDMILHD